MKAKNPVVWFEIYVDDMPRAKKFYETVLGLQLESMATPDTIEANMEMVSFPMVMDGDGAAGALVRMEGFKAGGGGTIVYFRSDDCATEEGRVEKAGGKIFQSKQSIAEFGFMVLAMDTEGNMFGIHSNK
ncbi:MAG: VOC family protein [Flavobacteriales bacterium]|jgi:predicted enzyme related to lactoylglutathione lyase|nr:VOC family protein [Flavobacteriales bacterium]MCI1752076.1 VOC family protein [Flavobacteriales bacterium]